VGGEDHERAAYVPLARTGVPLLRREFEIGVARPAAPGAEQRPRRCCAPVPRSRPAGETRSRAATKSPSSAAQACSGAREFGSRGRRAFEIAVLGAAAPGAAEEGIVPASAALDVLLYRTEENAVPGDRRQWVMHHWKLTAVTAVLLADAPIWSAPQMVAPKPPEVLQLTGDTQNVHDPAIIKEGDTYYVFCTGGGRAGQGVIPIRTSRDLHAWTMAGYVMEKLPDWVVREIPGAAGAWAPDISFYGGRFHLYYAVSTFGSRNSAIGLVTNATLDPKSPQSKWVDEGLVLRSYQEKDDWNAIDPNLFVEDKDHVWLNWGSFWGGIKMKRVDPATGKLSTQDTEMYSLSSRDRAQPVGGSVEAPFLVRHGDYFYLFVSFDRCCRGANSTYNVVVGRSRKVTGPYLDKDGKPMPEGGGSLVIVATTPNWKGPGHEAVVQEPGGDYLIFHAYHGTTGRSFLQISTMIWEDGWPKVGALP
jgi:arabinan endo-1,5-alpha-L-arabinosidase